MAKTIKRDSNGRVVFDYLPLEMNALYDIIENCSDEEIGELVRAFVVREQNGAAEAPTVKGTGRFYIHSLLGCIESNREYMDGKSKQNAVNGANSHNGSPGRKEPSRREVTPPYQSVPNGTNRYQSR